MGTGSFPGVRCGRGVTLTPHSLLVQRSKTEYSCTSALPKGLRGLWKGETYLHIQCLAYDSWLLVPIPRQINPIYSLISYILTSSLISSSHFRLSTLHIPQYTFVTCYFPVPSLHSTHTVHCIPPPSHYHTDTRSTHEIRTFNTGKTTCLV